MRIIVFIFLLAISEVWAQDSSVSQLWFNYALSIRPNTSLSYGGDIGVRGELNNDWRQILVRPAVSYRFNQVWGVSGAVALIQTIREAENTNSKEFRVHQDLNLNWPDMTILRLFYRLRVEEQWFFYQDTRPDDFQVRLRYLVGAESADIRLLSGQRPIYFLLLLEGFSISDAAGSDRFINRTRGYFAVGHRISDNFRYEFHYINQKSRRSAEGSLSITENIFRIRTFHRIRPKKIDDIQGDD